MAIADDVRQVHGFCDPHFEDVRKEFQRNFDERGELGAAIAIYAGGKLVVDLWGGIADEESSRSWNEDTLVTIFSSTKALTATCMHMLADRGLLELDAPVARYWPEFAANGKERITVAQVMSHQSGVVLWEDPLPKEGLFNWALATERLAAQRTFWEPGTTHGYHGTTIGFILGEVLRRITGRTVGRFFHEELALPLGLDAWIGLPESEEHRVAKIYLATPSNTSPTALRAKEDPDWIGQKTPGNTGNHNSAEYVNARVRNACENPSGNGIVTARSLARMYAPLSLDGSIDGVRIVSEERLPGMRATRSASSRDHILQIPTAFTLGYAKTWGDRRLGPGWHVIIGEQAFGHPGQGGNIGFADGQAGMAFAYVMNRHGSGGGLNDRGQSLVDAAYRTMGFSNSDPGFWVR